MSDEIIKLTERVWLRPVVLPDDEEFLQDVYATTREDVNLVPWDENLKREFILMQYRAQKAHYAEYYPRSDHYIILFDGRPAGRYWIDYGREDVRFVDMAVLPEFRGQGIGTVLFKDALKHAREMGLPAILHVIKGHRSIPMYKRMGFRFAGDNGAHDKMEWRPEYEETGAE